MAVKIRKGILITQPSTGQYDYRTKFLPVVTDACQQQILLKLLMVLHQKIIPTLRAIKTNAFLQ
jgi:hypothetical protein